MTWLWTWGGKSFGYRRGDLLFTKDGNNIGYFAEDEAYSLDGHYLGELRNENRLITNLNKKHKIKSPRAAYAGTSYADKVDYVGYVLYAGYEDFPEFE